MKAVALLPGKPGSAHSSLLERFLVLRLPKMFMYGQQTIPWHI